MVVAEELQILSEALTELPTQQAVARPGFNPAKLAEIVRQYATTGEWLPRVRLQPDKRWYERVYLGPDHDIWVISWMPGQSTGFHDHGSSSGAFTVVAGTLQELRAGESARAVGSGCSRAFGAKYAHDVRNTTDAPAISIHAYSPPLTEMNHYDLEEAGLVAATSQSSAANEDVHKQWALEHPRTSIDDMLAAARSRLRRLSPEEALQAVTTDGAVLVDIRPERQRAQEGSIERALIVERNVLEWRFDPTSEACLSIANSHDLPLIVFCSEGYTSSLAAAALQDLGLWRATDLRGGFKEWRRRGLPTQP